MPSYIIFHPDCARQELEVTAQIIRKRCTTVEKWSGQVIVDKVGDGNEDPWCITQPWLYSYCHATQLRRHAMKKGDILFFISGDRANGGVFSCDTVFVVEERLCWSGCSSGRVWIPKALPSKLRVYQEREAQEWLRHLRFGLPPHKQHSGQYAFTGAVHNDNAERYSFLPLDQSGIKTSIAFSELSSLAPKLIDKRYLKRPAILSDEERDSLYRLLYERAEIKVVKILTSPRPELKEGSCRGRC